MLCRRLVHILHRPHHNHTSALSTLVYVVSSEPFTSRSRRQLDTPQDLLAQTWRLQPLIVKEEVRGVVDQHRSRMELDSPQTPNFSGLKDYPMGLFKVSGPSRVPIYPMKEDLPHIPEKEEYHDSGVFFSSVDSTPEPREIEADFADAGSDSTEGSDNVSVDEGKEVLCSPDLDFDSDPEPTTCRLQSFFSPFKTEKVSLNDLSAGPPILDLTRLMMQPLRNTGSPKLERKSILPGNLLDNVSKGVREKVEAGQEVSKWTIEDEARTQISSETDRECNFDNENSLLCIDLVEETEEQPPKKTRKRGKKRKGATTTENKSSKKEKRTAPNYFVAVQISNPEVHSHVEKVQKRVAFCVPSLSAAFIPLPTLHITLHVAHLQDEDTISRAKTALDECQQKVISQWSGGHAPLLQVVGLGAFRDNVVFAKLQRGQSHELLSGMADTVNECLLEKDVHSTDDRGFQPHITVMKLSKAPRLRHKGIKKIDRDLYHAYSECEFGYQRILGLQLCSMFKPKDKDGYYHVEHEVKFDLPAGEPRDGSAGLKADFQPKAIIAKPIKTVVKLEKEITWSFHQPEERA